MNFTEILLGKNTNQFMLRLLILLSIILIIVWGLKRIDVSGLHEGFSQENRFVAKYNQDIYDPFYAKIYDTIHQPQNEHMAVLEAIKMTHPTPTNSLFLDIQSGTGSLMYFLQNKQYTVYGIEKSKAMIDQCLSNYPTLKIKNDDILVPITFDKNIFTHVLCTNFSIYQFKDKAQLFRNIYYWLQSNGYMILHLVDRNQYDTITPAGKPPLLTESPQTYSVERITNTEIDFIDFTYKSNVDFSKKDTTIITETFVDSLTHNVRQNEETLYMEDIGDILSIAQYCGFINHGQISLPFDKNQYIFVLERPL